MSKKIISTTNAPSAIGPYSQATEANSMVFCSGQLGLDPRSGNLVEGIKAQAELALQNLKAILEESGSSMDDILKTTIFLTDMANFATVNEIYASCFMGEYPARSCFAVAGLPKGALVEIEAIALKK